MIDHRERKKILDTIVDQGAADKLLQKYQKVLTDAARAFWEQHRDEYAEIQTDEFPHEKDSEMTHQFFESVDAIKIQLERPWTLIQ